MGINKDQVKGQVNQAAGRIKEFVGKVVGDEKLETKGKVQGIIGEVQTKLGDVREAVKDSTKKSA